MKQGIVSKRRSVHLWVVLYLVLAVLILCSGCSPQPRADLVFLNGAEPETLDPALITGQPEGRVANALFEGLLTFDQSGKPQPGMAESWTVSEDGRIYTFTLREGLTWSDGTPLTARDFVESWRRTLDPATASEYAYQLHYIKNARAFNEGKSVDFSQVGVSAPDEQTLRVELENPTPFFADLCAFVTLLPVPLHVIREHGDDWIKPGRLVSNGAYVLESWRLNDRIRLRKNPRYWNANAVAMKTIDVLPVSKANTAFNLYSSGQADLMMDKGLVPPALLGEIKKRDDFHAAPFLGTYFLRFNCTKGPFTDPRVRRAFSMVIDKQSIVDRITRAGELAADSFVPPGAGGYEPFGQCGGRDVEEARHLLAEAGFPGGEGFPMVNYLYSEGELNEAIAVELQSMWRQLLGVNVQLLRQEWKVYLNSMSRLDYDIARSSWVGDYPDPNTFLDMFVTGGGNNRTGWSDPRYDQLISAAAAETDRPARYEILREAEKLLVCEEMPVCPLYFYVGIQLYDSKKLGGIEGNVLDEHPLKAMFWKKAGD
jgi:oligopeptide transport system substrate-binding protein